MASIKKKILTVAVIAIMAISTALGLYIHQASAVNMGGAYNNASKISSSIRDALLTAATIRVSDGDPIAWFNIKKHGYKVNSASGGDLVDDTYWIWVSEADGSKTGDIELTYPNAGYIATTGDAVDLHVKAQLWCTYSKAKEGETERRAAVIDLNCKNLTCDGGNPGRAGIKFSMWVTKKGTSTRVNAYIPMLWSDIDQVVEPGVYGGVESVGLTSSASNVFTGTAVSSSEGHLSRNFGKAGFPYEPANGAEMVTNTWNGKFFYSGSHDCQHDGVGEYYTVKRDSCLGLIGHTSTSATFDVEWTAATLGCTTPFGLLDNSPDFGYLTIAKTSTNKATTKSPLCPEFYSLEGAAFDVKCVESDYLNAGVVAGTFECKKAEGGTCEVTAGATKGDSDTVMALPPGTYDIVETKAPKLGYMGQVGKTVDTVTIADNETVKRTGDDAIQNKPMARVVVEKLSDERNHWTYPLATYSRAGAQYGIFADLAATSRVSDGRGSGYTTTLTTRYEQVVADEAAGSVVAGDGKYVKVNPGGTSTSASQPGVAEPQTGWRVRSNVMMVPPDATYYLKESVASEGYTLDKESRAFTPGAGELVVVKSTETPSESPIHIYKNDATFKSLAASGANPYCANFLHGGSDWRAQGDATLTNAYFLVSYYDGYYASIPTGAPTYSWRIRTGTKSRESGEAFIGVETVDGKSETHNMAGSSASLLNNAGTATVPLGTITITEIKPPQGYTCKNAALKDPYVYLSQVRRYNQSTVKAHFPESLDGKPCKEAFYTTTTVDAGIANVREYTVEGAVSAADLALDANIDNAGNIEIYDTVIRGDAHLQKTDWDEEQLRNGYDPGNPWRVTDGVHPVPDMDVQKPEGNGTLKGAVFEVVSTSVNPVISPTDGKSIIWPGSIADGSLGWSDKPSGLTPVTVDKRSCGVNCYITTDVKGYATTKAGASVNNYVTAWKKGVRGNTTAYSTTDGNTIAWTTPSTWVGALAYGSYKTQEVKETDYGYLLNPGYRGEVKTRVNKQDDLIKTRYTGDPATWYPPEYAERVWGWKWYIDKFFFD